jgi:hypothetical protein
VPLCVFDPQWYWREYYESEHRKLIYDSETQIKLCEYIREELNNRNCDDRIHLEVNHQHHELQKHQLDIGKHGLRLNLQLKEDPSCRLSLDWHADCDAHDAKVCENEKMLRNLRQSIVAAYGPEVLGEEQRKSRDYDRTFDAATRAKQRDRCEYFLSVRDAANERLGAEDSSWRCSGSSVCSTNDNEIADKSDS